MGWRTGPNSDRRSAQGSIRRSVACPRHDVVEERRRAVQAGDDRHRISGERVPAADPMDEGFVAGEQLRHLDDIEDRIAAHPDIGDAQRPTPDATAVSNSA